MNQRLPTALALAAASSAPGAIVIFDIPDLTLSDGQLGYNGARIDSFDLNNKSFTFTTFSSPAFAPAPRADNFTFGTYNYGYGSAGRVFFGYGIFRPVASSASGGGALLNLFAPGSVVSSNTTFSNLNPVQSYNGDLDSASGTFYVGLRWQGNGSDNYGWLEVNYGARVGDVRDYTFTRFAFNDVAGQSITTPAAVPEASTLGLVGGLFGLVAAAHVRRRRQQQAAASDTFLALAAGEKLN